jgi:hypothetical protein
MVTGYQQRCPDCWNYCRRHHAVWTFCCLLLLSLRTVCGEITLYSTAYIGIDSYPWAGTIAAFASSSTGQNIMTLMTTADTVAVYASQNFGGSWKLVHTWTNGFTIGSYQIMLDSSGCIIFAGSDYNMFESFDCGDTWRSASWLPATVIDATGRYHLSSYSYSTSYGYVLRGIHANNELTSATCNGNFTFAAGAYCYHDSYNGYHVGVYTSQSPTNASSWALQELSTGSKMTPCTDVVIKTDILGKALIVVSVDTQLVYYSSNQGVNWTKFENLPSQTLWTDVDCAYTCQHIVLTGYQNSSSKSDSVVHVYVSDDFGASWSPVNMPVCSNTLPAEPSLSTSGGTLVVFAGGHILISCNPLYDSQTTVVSSGLNASHTVSNLGSICDGLYLKVSVAASYLEPSADYVLTMLALNADGSSYAVIAQDAFDIVSTCGSGDVVGAGWNENIYVSSDFIRGNGDGSVTIVAIVSRADGGNVVSCNQSTFFELNYRFSAQPVSSTSPPSDPVYGLGFVVTLVLVPLVGALCGLVADWRYRYFSDVRRLSLLRSVIQFGLVSFFVVVEIGLFISFYSTKKYFYDEDMDKFLLASVCILTARGIQAVAGIFVLIQFAGLRQLWIASTNYSALLSAELVKSSELRYLTRLLSLFVICDPEMVIYFPWSKNSTCSTVGGYPDKNMMNVSLLFKSIASTVSVVAQIICYRSAFSFRYSNRSVYWTGQQLGFKFILISYSFAYVLYSIPIFYAANIHFLETVQRRVGRSFSTSMMTAGNVVWDVLNWTRCKHWYRGSYRNSFVGCHFIKNMHITGLTALCKIIVSWALFSTMSTWHCDTRSWTTWEPLWMTWVPLLVAVSTTAAISEVLMAMFTGFDAHLEILLVAESRSFDVAALTRLLQPTVVIFAVLDVATWVLMFLVQYELIPFAHARHRDWCHGTPINEAPPMVYILIVLLVIELLTPMITWSLHQYRTKKSAKAAWVGLCRLDIQGLGWFFKIMLCWLFPLSVLSNISILKANESTLSDVDRKIADDQKKGTGASPDLLSFQLRDNWNTVDREEDASDSIWGTVHLVVLRLTKRFTVVYSFAKLLGTIVFTLVANTAYLGCISPDRYWQAATCNIGYVWDVDPTSSNPTDVSPQSTCFSLCIGGSHLARTTYPPLQEADSPPFPPNPWECQLELSGQCLCNNWFTFQFSVILLHVVHYVVQCYFYVRYNYFDPQQNQINCVETYTFAGQNLALFLTQPSMCLLSVVEAISIVIVWIEVIFNPGASCSYDSLNSFHLEFAVFVTFMEVYKANLSTGGKYWNQQEYWWAFWSMLRIDLFVFYGFTLFLQAFFFPFSIVGAISASFARSRKNEYVTVRGDGDDADSNQDAEDIVVNNGAGLQQTLLMKDDG